MWMCFHVCLLIDFFFVLFVWLLFNILWMCSQGVKTLGLVFFCSCSLFFISYVEYKDCFFLFFFCLSAEKFAGLLAHQLPVDPEKARMLEARLIGMVRIDGTLKAPVSSCVAHFLSFSQSVDKIGSWWQQQISCLYFSNEAVPISVMSTCVPVMSTCVATILLISRKECKVRCVVWLYCFFFSLNSGKVCTLSFKNTLLEMGGISFELLKNGHVFEFVRKIRRAVCR